MALKGEKVFFAVAKGENVDKYIAIVKELGGTVISKFMAQVTCVVFQGGSKPHWTKAVKDGIELVDPKWLIACKDAGKKVAVTKNLKATQEKVSTAAKVDTKKQEEEDKVKKGASTTKQGTVSTKPVKGESLEASVDLRDSMFSGEESTHDEVAQNTNNQDIYDEEDEEVKENSVEKEQSKKGQQKPQKNQKEEKEEKKVPNKKGQV